MRFNRLRSLFQNPGARSVFLPRLPLPKLKATGNPLLSGTRNIPFTFEVVNVRKLPVKGSSVKAPVGLKLGRSPFAPLPFESTPVMMENGWPDWNAVTPENCQPLKICLIPGACAKDDLNQGIS